MVCIWIELTHMFTESVLVLNPQWKRPEVPSVSRSLLIIDKTYPVKFAPNLFSFSSLNQSSSFFLKDCKCTFWNARYCAFSKSDSVTDGTNEISLKLILCTIKVIMRHLLYYPETILSLFCH